MIYVNCGCGLSGLGRELSCTVEVVLLYVGKNDDICTPVGAAGNVDGGDGRARDEGNSNSLATGVRPDPRSTYANFGTLGKIVGIVDIS